MKIGAFAIHPGVIWSDEITAKSVQTITTTINGNISIIHAKIEKPQMIFEARDTGGSARGYFTREVVEYLLTAEHNLFQFEITYRGVSYTVIIPSGGVQLTGKRETEEVEATDPYYGTLTVQVV